MHLYEIASEIESVLASEDGELTEEQFAALDKLEMNFTDKAENVAKFIRSQEAEAKAFADEAKRLSAKASARKNKVIALKQYLQQCMTALDLRTVNGKVLKIAIQKNVPSLDITNEDAIPQQYWVVDDPHLDKRALLAALKAKEEIDGAEIKQTESIRIR